MKSPRVLPILDVLNPSVCRVQDFIFKADEKHYDIWFDTQLNRAYEEHKLYRFSQEDLYLYQERKERYEDWVGIQFISVRDESGCKHIRVFTERILLTLNQIEQMDFQEAITILLQSLIGFQSLFSRFHDLEITSKMICINQERRVKAWVNQEYHKNQKPKNESQISQEDMVLRIFMLVQQRISDSNLLRQYKKTKQDRLGGLSFQSAILFVKGVMEENGMGEMREIDLSRLRINRQSNAPKLKFQRKNGLNRGNRPAGLRPKVSVQVKQNVLGFQKTRSVKYFHNPSSETRSRSKSTLSQKLSFSTKSKVASMKSSNAFQLLSPTSLIKSQKLKSQMTPLKASESTMSELKNTSPNSHQPIPPSISKSKSKIIDPKNSQLNIKFIKQSIICYKQPVDQIPAQELFKDLKLFNSIKDLKKSQFFDSHGPYTPPPTPLITSFPRSNSVLAKSFYDINIKEIIQQEYD